MAKKRTDVIRQPLDAALLAEFADFPNIDVLERRLVNPEVPGTLPIRLKDEPAEHDDPKGLARKWYLRWVNTTIPGRYSGMTTGRGYVPVAWDELQDLEQITERHEGAAHVRRGEKGQEVLVKMPLKLYLEIKRRERARIDARSRSVTAIKSELAAAAESAFGDQAAEAVQGFVGEVKEGRETWQ